MFCCSLNNTGNKRWAEESFCHRVDYPVKPGQRKRREKRSQQRRQGGVDEPDGRVEQVPDQWGRIHDAHVPPPMVSTSCLPPCECSSGAHYSAGFIVQNTRRSRSPPSIDLHINLVCRLSISWFYEAAHTQTTMRADSARVECCKTNMHIHSNNHGLCVCVLSSGGKMKTDRPAANY